MRDEIIFCMHCGEVDSLDGDYCTCCGCSQTTPKKETLPDEQPDQNNMAQEQIFAPGIRLFDKHPNAPDFVLASQVITLNDLFEWVKANPQFLVDYQGKKQLKLQVLRSKDGKIYMTVDTYGTPAAAQLAPAAPAQQWGAPQPAPAQQPQWGAAPAQPAPVQNGWGAPAPQPQQPQQQAFNYDQLPF
jgi:hypothetical protein